MSEPSNRDERSTGAGADEAASAPDFLGGRQDELALFAIARTPRAYRPLTDAEATNLRAAVNGTLPPGLSGSLRELLKHNAAASEFVLSEQLLVAANRSVDIPAPLSRRILKDARPVAAKASARWWPLRSWQSVGVGAAAAALAIALAFYGLNAPGSPNFSVAALDDREILGEAGGTLTRGAPRPAGQTPAASTLKYVEIDVRKGLLTSFFAADQRGSRTDEDATIARLSGALNEKEKVGFIFDAAIKPLLIGDMGETLTLRVYDLSDRANEKLTSRLRPPTVGKSYFLSPAR